MPVMKRRFAFTARTTPPVGGWTLQRAPNAELSSEKVVHHLWRVLRFHPSQFRQEGQNHRRAERARRHLSQNVPRGLAGDHLRQRWSVRVAQLPSATHWRRGGQIC